MIGRQIQVRVGKELSQQCDVENGTPQGSVISPIIFSIMINDVFSQVQPDIARSLFADDGALWKRGRNIMYIHGKIQEAITQVEQWAADWGFKFSVEKTNVVVFTRKRVLPEMSLKMYGRDLERVKVFRFLGIIFDEKLVWNEHIKKIVGKCQKVLNIMRGLSGVEWGASFSSLKAIYLAMIRSVFDYGSIVYGTASKTQLEKLDKVQAQALRQCCGAVKSTPIPALQVLAGEMPLEIRRIQLMSNYWGNLKGHKEQHPTKVVLQDCWEQMEQQCKSFGWASKVYADEIGITNINMSPTVVIPEVAPWRHNMPKIDFYLLEFKRTEREEVDMLLAFAEHINQQYAQYMQVYTDGSKIPENQCTGVAFSVPERNVCVNKRTTDCLGVYTVELVAVLLALQWIDDNKPGNILICSDSVSVLKSLRSFRSSRQDILFKILELHSRIIQQGMMIGFMWIPAHVGLRGNEEVDELAKQAVKRDSVELHIPLSKAEVKGMVWRKAIEEWQGKWNNETRGRFLYSINNTVSINTAVRNMGRTRKEEIICNRIRLGHSNLNSTLRRIGKHPTGLCEYCQTEETITHAIIECTKYREERQNLKEKLEEKGVKEFTIKRLMNLSGTNFQNFLDFIRQTGLLNRI